MRRLWGRRYTKRVTDRPEEPGQPLTARRLHSPLRRGASETVTPPESNVAHGLETGSLAVRRRRARSTTCSARPTRSCAASPRPSAATTRRDAQPHGARQRGVAQARASRPRVADTSPLHFKRIAARAMRQVLIEAARRRHARQARRRRRRRDVRRRRSSETPPRPTTCSRSTRRSTTWRVSSRARR